MPDARSLDIALWGHTQAGKTVFLAQLFHRSMGTGWRILPTQVGRTFIDTTRDDFTNNRFPPPTPVGGGAQLRYRLQKGDVTITLAIEDRPGAEFRAAFTDQNDVPTRDGRRPTRELLLSADGLVILLHPTALPSVLEQQVKSMLESIYIARGERIDDRPIAVCLSKADSLIESPSDFRLVLEDPEAFVLRKCPTGLKGWVANYCERVKFFPISSVGVRLRYGVAEPLVVRDSTLKLRVGSGGTPINLMAPFEWLISELAIAR